MKTIHSVLMVSAVALATAGCIRSHRPAVVYYTPPPVVAAPPTSDRPDVRVYPSGPVKTVTPPSTPPPGVEPGDVAVADAVSQLLKGEPSLASASRNIEATVDHGTVTLRGTVPTEHDRDEIVQRVGKLPGVSRVSDQLGVSYR
jgi:hypothetical protein